MTDQESGTDPVDTTMVAEAVDPGETEPGQAGEPSFLGDLARAMQSTAAAERSRDEETTEQRRQAHLDAIRAREAVEAEELRELAKEDVAGIDAWSDGEIRRIKLERERRISARREQLQLRLEEHRQVIGREISAVETAIGTYRQQIDAFFADLESETDPVEIARRAGERPRFPELELIGLEEVSEAPLPGATVTDSATGSEDPVVPADGSTDGASSETPEAAGEGPATGTIDTTSTDRLIGVMDDGTTVTTTEVDQRPHEPVEPAIPAEIAALVGGGGGASSAQDPPDDAAAGDARGVQPRTGAGSWLRWPNSSPDHPDSPK